MARTEGYNSWDKIQLGVKDTERLIGQKDYCAAMIKARQTLEYMVKILADRASIADGSDLMTMIDVLYQNHWITKISCEHYHKIRMIGNKAVHEGDSNAYNANQAYHLLSQEVYSFANDYRNAQRGSTPRRSSHQDSGNRSRKKQKKRKGITIYDLLKLLIPILCIILLVLVIKLVKPSDNKNNEPATTPTTTETIDEVQSSTAPEETPTAVVYKTTTTVNVRSQPNTDTDRIAKLGPGVTVEYVRNHDDKWIVILYNGQEAYIASQYITTE